MRSTSSETIRISGPGRRRKPASTRSSSASSGAKEGSARAASAIPDALPLDPRRSLGERANGSHAAACDEECATEAGLARGREDTQALRSESCELVDTSHRLVEGADAVAQSSSVLEAQIAREPGELGAERGERFREVVPVEVAESASGELLLGACSRSGRTGSASATTAHPSAATLEVRLAAGTSPRAFAGGRSSRIRRSSSSAASSSEPSTRHSTRVERPECGLHGGPLPRAGEVRAQPCPKVACLADVEHRVVPVAEEVDAGSGRRTRDERALSRAACEPVALASSTTSASVLAPRSCARPISAMRISAVASASGSARWHGSHDVPKKCASCASE